VNIGFDETKQIDLGTINAPLLSDKNSSYKERLRNVEFKYFEENGSYVFLMTFLIGNDEMKSLILANFTFFAFLKCLHCVALRKTYLLFYYD